MMHFDIVRECMLFVFDAADRKALTAVGVAPAHTTDVAVQGPAPRGGRATLRRRPEVGVAAETQVIEKGLKRQCGSFKRWCIIHN